MIQLSFQPSLDPFHTMYRLLRLRDILNGTNGIPVDHLRILDFYLVFPHRLPALRLKTEHRRFRTAALRLKRPMPYGDQPDDKITFGRMQPIQEVAMQTLASHELLSGSRLDRGIAADGSSATPERLLKRVTEANANDPNLIALLELLARDYQLTGEGGLKGRSGLLEYRYDAV